MRVGQNLAFNELHHERASLVQFFEARNLRDIRVIQSGEYFCFPRSVDLAHAAGANRSDDLIRPEPSTGTEGHGLSGRRRDCTGSGTATSWSDSEDELHAAAELVSCATCGQFFAHTSNARAREHQIVPTPE